MGKNSDTNILTSLHKIYAKDGIELDSILFEPAAGTKKIIIHVHGKEGHFIQNHFIQTMGRTYPQHGYSLLTFNNRGHDYMADLIKKTSSGYIWEQGGSIYDILENAELDLQGIMEYVMDLGYDDITLQGHSLGPHKICYYLTKNKQAPVKRLILLTTADVQYQFDYSIPDWPKYALIAKSMVDEGKGDQLMPVRLWSNCPISAKSFWNYTKPDNNCFVFNTTHPDSEFKNFNKIKLPMIIVNPQNDVATGIKQEKAVDLIQKNSASTDFEAHIVPDSVHNFLGKEEEMVRIIVDWLKRHQQ